MPTPPAIPSTSFLVPFYRVYQWLVLLPIAALATAFFAMLALALTTFSSPALASAWAGRPWARLIAALTPARVRVRGRQHVDPGESYVVVANHLSLFDIFVLYGWLDLDFRWVMKREVRRIPGVGIACEHIGHIFIDRSDPSSANASLEAAKQRIGKGTSTVFFPEGTRGPGNHLLRFKKGAFRFATDLGRPILPISIVGTDRILPAHSLRLWPGTATMIFHPPVAPPAADRKDLQKVMDSVRDTIGGPVLDRSRQ